MEEQPKLEGGLGLVVDDAGLAAKSTTREGGSTFSAQTSKKVNRGVGVAAEDGTEDGGHVDSDVAEDLTEETQGTGLHGLIGRVGESRARQTGEHNERRTHVAFFFVSD